MSTHSGAVRGTIQRIESAHLSGERPRSAGCNARLGQHGLTINPVFARVTIDGETGFGWSTIDRESAQSLIGTDAGALIAADGRVAMAGREIEYPLLDWLGHRSGKPVYALIGSQDAETPLTVPCYDTSLYIDDLECRDDREAVALLQQQARDGWDRGHRAFKLKVGRGARHMDTESGMKRDAAIVHGVREGLGPHAALMLDANNGLNLNLTKRLLQDTAGANIFWMEEPFHEDPVLYRLLKDWLEQRHLPTLIADGEGDASRHIVEWALEGIIDVVQYDILRPGFTAWRELAPTLDSGGVCTAPHSYGAFYGNYAACHLAPAIRGFLYAEWDEARVPGIDASGYRITEGRVEVPPAPGFGLELDARYFEGKVRENGWTTA